MNSDLSVFNIPTDLLSRFEPTEKAQEEQLLNQVKEEEDTTAINARALERLQIQEERLQDENGNLTCRTCDLTFNSSQREEQRLHFNSDWHRYNIKRRLVLNAQPVTFEEFEVLLADLTESLSGSESESETSDVQDDDEKKDKIETLVDKQQEQEQEQVVAPKADLLPVMKKYTALCWFRLKDDVSQHYGIYRHLLTQPNVESVERIQASQFKGKKRMWAIIMIGGGHFAGSIMDVEKSGRSENLVKVLYHKTFHRYTTRRKQGGSQSTNDNAKGAANSAGAMIRRYNEQMLQEEVRQVLNQWRTQLESCEFVFVHAPSGNRKIVYNYPDAVLVQNGSNVRSIPFTTRRPTLNELKRVFIELSTLKSIHIDAETIQQFEQKQLEKYESQKSQLERSKAQKKTVDTIEKIEVDPDLEKLISLVKQNKAGVAIEFIRKHMNLPIAGLLPEHVEDTRHYPTMLHVAAGAGCNEFVACLLREHDADPTIVSDAGKSAYEVSKDKPTRNAFRRCMYDIPDKWDWLAEARVPSPLSEKQEAEQTAKDQKKLAKEKEKQRLIDLERAKVEAKREAKETETKFEKMQAQRAKANMMPIARALGVGSSAVNTANMSPEARMRLEREKRARAAEERMKRLGK